jgi:uncharacterized protein (DUF488 family)
MKLFTIGSTEKSAERFFELLRTAGVRSIADIRLNNRSQLAGFSKSHDLEYFAKAILGVPYGHYLELAPSKELLDEYRNGSGEWKRYERGFLKLLTGRRVEQSLAPKELDGAALLCSEASPDQCHRRLVAEYLARHWKGVEIIHLR